MLSIFLRLIFWGLIIAVGTQTGFGIMKMRDKMREVALKKMAEPWPELPVMPQVDHSKAAYKKWLEKRSKSKSR